MKKILLPYEQTGYFSKVVTDYLSEVPSLKPFYVLPPDIGSFPFIVELKKKDPVNRDQLTRSLLQQHSRLFGEMNLDAVRSNIESLQSSNTFSVTTAHQPNLFLGPLYTIYKTISTIVIGRLTMKDAPRPSPALLARTVPP